jgi:hypothetical protein
MHVTRDVLQMWLNLLRRGSLEMLEDNLEAAKAQATSEVFIPETASLEQARKILEARVSGTEEPKASRSDRSPESTRPALAGNAQRLVTEKRRCRHCKALTGYPHESWCQRVKARLG